MTYALVTVEIPKDENLWMQFLWTASRHAKRDELNQTPRQNRWLLALEADVLLFSALVVSAESKGLAYTIHIFDSEPSVISKEGLV